MSLGRATRGGAAIRPAGAGWALVAFVFAFADSAAGQGERRAAPGPGAARTAPAAQAERTEEPALDLGLDLGPPRRPDLDGLAEDYARLLAAVEPWRRPPGSPRAQAALVGLPSRMETLGWRAEVDGLLRRARLMPELGLSPEERAERRWLIARLEAEALLAELRPWANAPDWYLRRAWMALDELPAKDADLALWLLYLERLRGISALFDEGRARLLRVSEPAIRHAAGEFEALRAALAGPILQAVLAARLDPGPRQWLVTAVRSAVEATSEFERHALARPGRNESPQALGRAKFERLAALRTGVERDHWAIQRAALSWLEGTPPPRADADPTELKLGTLAQDMRAALAEAPGLARRLGFPARAAGAPRLSARVALGPWDPPIVRPTGRRPDREHLELVLPPLGAEDAMARERAGRLDRPSLRAGALLLFDPGEARQSSREAYDPLADGLRARAASLAVARAILDLGPFERAAVGEVADDPEARAALERELRRAAGRLLAATRLHAQGLDIEQVVEEFILLTGFGPEVARGEVERAWLRPDDAWPALIAVDLSERAGSLGGGIARGSALLSLVRLWARHPRTLPAEAGRSM